MKYGIYIKNGDGSKRVLFAVVKEENVEKYRSLAWKEIIKKEYPSDWVSVKEWRLPERKSWCDTHGYRALSAHDINECTNDMTEEQYRDYWHFSSVGNLFSN